MAKTKAAAPSIEQRGREWVLKPIRENQFESLSEVPGLRLVADEARGPIDAIAAACFRLGVQAPDPSGDGKAKLVIPPNLYDFQKLGVKFVVERLLRFGGCILADDMGLGKTRQGAIVMKELCESTLVLCPASVRESWRKELKTLGVPDKKVAILGPPSDKFYDKEWEKASTAAWVVSSYDLADRAVMEAFVGRQPEGLVLDEAQLVRGRDSKRSALVDNIAGLVNYRLALSGTPMWDRPKDFYKILNILLPRSFGSPRAFDFVYCGAQEGEWGGYEAKGATRTEELKLRLAYYMLRREKREVASQLPKLSREVIWLPPEKAAHAAYIRSMASKSSDGTYHALRATLEAKIPAAVELACTARRFLLFSYEKSHVATLAKHIKAAGVPCEVVTGDLPTHERQRRITEAAAHGCGVVATIDSTSTGVDGLQHVASTGIFHALDWQPNKMAQAEGRLDRIGQKEPVQWKYLAMRDTMDEPVANLLIQKLDQWHALMGGNRDMRNALDANIGGAGQDPKTLLAMLYGMSDREGVDHGDDE
jgi:SWI/SNF-related matrix-associated actin-dependent regulator 1 of chromatin subfamily A